MQKPKDKHKPKQAAALIVADIPDGPTRESLAKLYAALANELVAWKAAHPQTGEQDPAAAPPPIIVQLHDVAQDMFNELPPDPKDPSEIPPAVLSDGTRRMNEILAKYAAKIGTFELREEQAARLVFLMVVNEYFSRLSPYEPRPMARAW